MARASTTQRRRRPQPPARRPAPSPEDLMFFPKLRKRAKWVFLMLAVLFALSVVFFGVGTGIPGANPWDAIQGLFEERRASGGPSVDAAQERVAENPKDAKARLDLANALQAEGRTPDAIAQLEVYTEMKPRDTNALQQLAALYDAQATEAQNSAIEAQLEAQRHVFPETFAPPEQSRIREETGGGAIAETVTAQAGQRASAAYQEMQAAYSKEADAYRKLTRLVPDDPLLHLQLGQASQFAGDTKGAVAAYKQYLVLAPDDPNAPLVRQELRRLQPKPGKG
jgi:tetratricopeptide (TPR) repeat protein